MITFYNNNNVLCDYSIWKNKCVTAISQEMGWEYSDIRYLHHMDGSTMLFEGGLD